MGSRYEVVVTILSAKDLQNVNRRLGRLKPYAVVWVDPKNKSTTRVDEEGDTCPNWNQTLVIPFNTPVNDSNLYIDIVHAKAAEDTKLLIGSARFPLLDVNLGEQAVKKLELKCPSGNPRGKVDVKVAMRRTRYQPAGHPKSSGSGYVHGNVNVEFPMHETPSQAPNSSGAPSYGQPAQPYYGQPAQPSYGQGQASYEQPAYGDWGYVNGADYVEDADDVADPVDDDNDYDDDDDY